MPKDLQDLSKLSLSEQEAAIVEDLLFCCQGIDGAYIHSNPLTDPFAVRTFTVHKKLDKSLRDLTERILPICSNYSMVVRFIEEKSKYEFGLVNQALAATLKSLIRDFAVLVAQLEHQSNMGNLTLQKFWFYIQPSMRTMEVLFSVLTPINKVNNFFTTFMFFALNFVTGREQLTGSKHWWKCVKHTALQDFLVYWASLPYFEMLENWIYKGIINDPYSERYTIRRESVPAFLEQLSSKILNTGKYLNVVRQSDLDVKCPTAESLMYTLEKRLYIDKIEQAFQYASSLLLDLLMNKMDLMARLRSIKHYFMLDQGDFVVQFMDLTEHELKKPADEILLSRLETLLELSLRTSTANVDPYKDDLRVDLLPFDLVSQLFKILSIETKQEKDYKEVTDIRLSGLESFSFDYTVHWPVSLVLNRKALTRYQMLSRHFFYAKHVERQLCNVWVKDKSSKILQSTSASLCSHAYALRQRMLNFVQNFEYYVMFEVVEPQWQIFEANMAKVSNIDEVLLHHTDLLSNCLKDCMLTDSDLLKTLHKLMMICVTFCNFMQRLSANLDSSNNVQPTLSSSLSSSLSASWRDEKEKRKVINKALSEHMDEITSNDNYELTVANFDTNFSKYLVDLLDKIVDYSVSKCEHKLLNIIHRLDYNGFYKKQLDKLVVEKRLSSSKKMGAGDSSKN
ncbi:hypothetical protein HELRODRAFT_170184 [Helobdella robusta]|uniref:Gamma-tubulin complex component n=1 Tax=Helobdella robusta TaxID=6412 RepID=T1F2R7_HELRO|nr:hypothetical protein HELRODRAFT_170184 [Helobdella robusta]ESO07657.1 hypothetical protein HELRODRAFT_170184 [Helobdella robusta]